MPDWGLLMVNVGTRTVRPASGWTRIQPSNATFAWATPGGPPDGDALAPPDLPELEHAAPATTTVASTSTGTRHVRVRVRPVAARSIIAVLGTPTLCNRRRSRWRGG